MSGFHHWILLSRTSLDSKFQLKKQFWFFGTNFPQNGYSESKAKIMNIAITFPLFELVCVTNLTDNFFFGQICWERYFQSRTHETNTIIKFSIFELVSVSNYILKKQYSFFGPNFSKKCIPGLKKTKKLKIQFCIIELSFVQNFTFKLTIWIFGPTMSKKSIANVKQIKRAPLLNYVYLH